MRVPYFRAKDKDSEAYVEGFYVEFPQHNNFNQECPLVHAIMVVTPDTNSIPMMPMLGMMGSEAQDQLKQALGSRNTLNFCTIDITTLQQIGEVEIGEKYFNPTSYIKNPHGSIVLG